MSVKWMPDSLASKWVFSDWFMLPIVPRNIFIILVSEELWLDGIRLQDSSQLHPRWEILPFIHDLHHKRQVSSFLISLNIKEKKYLENSFLLQNTRNIDLLVSIILLCDGNNSRDEIVGRAFENEIFRVNFHHPNKEAEYEKCFK